MKKKLLIPSIVCSVVAIAAYAYSAGDIVKASDSCGNCKANGPAAFICGKCDRSFSRVTTIETRDAYDVIKYSHEGHQEYETCQHSMTAKLYK